MSKQIDWPAVLMRAACNGLQIVPIDVEQWGNAIGSGALVVLDLDEKVIWMHPSARVADLEQALLAADPHSYPYLKRPTDVMSFGESAREAHPSARS